MQCRHQLTQHWAHRGIEEVGSEVIDAELECSETLADEIGSCAQRVDEGFHEVAEIR